MLARDYPTVQAVILLFSFVYVLINLLVDLVVHGARSEDPLLSATADAIGLEAPAGTAAGAAAAERCAASRAIRSCSIGAVILLP